MSALPLLLLPGTLCDRRVFDPVIAALNTGGVPAASTTTVADIGSATTIGAAAAGVLKQAPSSFVVCGLSQGGMVAIEICRRAPQRVCGLVLLSTNPLAETPLRSAARAQLLKRAAAGDFDGVLRDELLPAYFSHRRCRALGLERVVIDMANTLGVAVLARQASALRSRPDMRMTLTQLSLPTLWLAGQEDRLVPAAMQREVAQNMLDARFRVLPDCGHLCTLEAPQRVAAEIAAWWPRLVGGS